MFIDTNLKVINTVSPRFGDYDIKELFKNKKYELEFENYSDKMFDTIDTDFKKSIWLLSHDMNYFKESMSITKDYNLKVKFGDKYIQIDSFLPFYEKTEDVVFVTTSSKKNWLPLYYKAYYALFGEVCKNDSIIDIFQNMVQLNYTIINNKININSILDSFKFLNNEYLIIKINNNYYRCIDNKTYFDFYTNKLNKLDIDKVEELYVFKKTYKKYSNVYSNYFDLVLVDFYNKDEECIFYFKQFLDLSNTNVYFKILIHNKDKSLSYDPFFINSIYHSSTLNLKKGNHIMTIECFNNNKYDIDFTIGIESDSNISFKADYKDLNKIDNYFNKFIEYDQLYWKSYYLKNINKFEVIEKVKKSNYNKLILTSDICQGKFFVIETNNKCCEFEIKIESENHLNDNYEEFEKYNKIYLENNDALVYLFINDFYEFKDQNKVKINADIKDKVVDKKNKKNCIIF